MKFSFKLAPFRGDRAMNQNTPKAPHTDLDLLFRPRSVAIIGVTQDVTRGGGFLWRRLKEHGYQGKTFPVGRTCMEMDGIPCYRSVCDIPDVVDLAIAAVPAPVVEKVMTECGAKQVPFVVVHTAGFAESGDEGKDMQLKIREIARKDGMRFVGPNCMGIFSPEVHLNTIVELDECDSVPGHVAFCGQSGWATENFIAGGSARGLRFNTVISSGNQADLALCDYISYFGEDPGTTVICAYVEGVDRGKDLLELASAIAKRKPVVIWKSGFSSAGARAALSHSGSMAGNREVWQGGARSAGIIAAYHFEELLDMAVAFSHPPYPTGKRVGIIAEAGGGAISASDACENLGLEVCRFSPGLQDRLQDFLKNYLPPFSGTTNPLDVVWLPRAHALDITEKCLELVSSEVDAIIIMTYLPFAAPETRASYIERVVRLRDQSRVPVYVVPPYASRGAEGMKDLTAAGIPALPSFERAARVVDATARYNERKLVLSEI
jgi:acyl-CoA synthetase (NDP forming)